MFFNVPKFFLPKCKKNVLQVNINNNTEKKMSSQAYVNGSAIFTCCGLNRKKSVDRIAGRIKAVGNTPKSCFLFILIDENNLDNHTYEMNNITAVIE